MNLARSSPSHNEFGDEEIRDIVIRSYTIIGSVSGIGYSSVQVEAREAIVAERRLTSYMVRLELNSGGDYPQTAASIIEYDRIDDFLSMLDKLAMTNISTDRFSFSEVEYEINGFKIIVFNNDRGSLMVAFTSEGVSMHLSSVSKIPELRRLVANAKECLDRNRVNFQ